MNKIKMTLNNGITHNISTITFNKVDGDFDFRKLWIIIFFSLVVISLFAFSVISHIAVLFVFIFFSFIILYF